MARRRRRVSPTTTRQTVPTVVQSGPMRQIAGPPDPDAVAVTAAVDDHRRAVVDAACAALADFEDAAEECRLRLWEAVAKVGHRAVVAATGLSHGALERWIDDRTAPAGATLRRARQRRQQTPTMKEGHTP